MDVNGTFSDSFDDFFGSRFGSSLYYPFSFLWQVHEVSPEAVGCFAMEQHQFSPPNRVGCEISRAVT